MTMIVFIWMGLKCLHKCACKTEAEGNATQIEEKTHIRGGGSAMMEAESDAVEKQGMFEATRG